MDQTTQASRVKKSIYLVLIGMAAFAYGAYIPAKAQLAQYLIHNAWTQAKHTGEKIKPWSWMDTHPMMRLSSDKHQQDLIVLSGDTGNVLAFAPGYNVQSNMPNQGGTTIISAHRDTHFSFLQDVVLGDEFKLNLTSDNADYHYQVSGIKIINADEQDIVITDNISEIKLITCYPFNAIVAGGPLRYVVTAELIRI